MRLAFTALVAILLVALFLQSGVSQAQSLAMPPTVAPKPTSAPPVPTPHPCEGVKIKRPKLLSPADGVQMPQLPFELTWTRPNCAYHYVLIIGQDTTARSFVVRRTDFPGNAYLVFDLPAGAYKWRVRACFRDTCSKRTPWRRFSIQR